MIIKEKNVVSWAFNLQQSVNRGSVFLHIDVPVNADLGTNYDSVKI